MARNIKPRAEDYPQWYLDVIKAAQLADYAPVRGCMVILPYGFALWEGIQRELDGRFKETGHVNAYFPLFIPASFLAQEAQHVEGFAMECAVVTHSGLERGEDGKLRPRGPLEEPLVVRPTSETIIGHMFARWVQSWRDLPLLVNQWANIVRWELRTRLFLRTAEFLWQEGHTAHETPEEAAEETARMLQVYRSFAREFLAIPVFAGEKTATQRFPGAVHTYCIEGLMQDGKALQCGTSHHLGQNFARAFNIKFESRDQRLQLAWTTSWGVSTRLIGALVMTHSDDEGLVLPPRIAPLPAVVVPIFTSEEEKKLVLDYGKQLLATLCGPEELARAERLPGSGEQLRVTYDRFTGRSLLLDIRERLRPVEKHYHWEQRGVPLRLELGPREVAAGKLVLKERPTGNKVVLEKNNFGPETFRRKLEELQTQMLERATSFRDQHTYDVDTRQTLLEGLQEGRGFYRCFFQPDPEAEEAIKRESGGGTVRLILPEAEKTAREGICVASGRKTAIQVLFAQAY